MRKVLQIVCAVLVVAFSATVALADTYTNIVVNGTFLTGTPINGGYVDLTPGSTALTGWTIGGNSVDVVTSGLWQAPPSGGNSLDLSGYGAGLTSQVLNTAPAPAYWTLSFYLAANPSNSTDPQYQSPADKSVLVSFGNYSWTFTVSSAGSTYANMNWQLITVSNIYIDSSPTTLTFTSLTPGAFGPVIGGVSVVDPPAVPEPASMVLFGTGLIGIAGFARKMIR